MKDCHWWAFVLHVLQLGPVLRFSVTLYRGVKTMVRGGCCGSGDCGNGCGGCCGGGGGAGCGGCGGGGNGCGCCCGGGGCDGCGGCDSGGGVAAISSNGKYERYLENWRDVCMLRFLESFLEGAPQVLIRLYILSQHHKASSTTTTTTTTATVAVAVLEVTNDKILYNKYEAPTGR